MPQMAPINWLSLNILFLMVFIIFIIMNYYSFLYQPQTKMLDTKKSSINWKW